MGQLDVYEVVDVQMLAGQVVNNVYFYEQRNAFVHTFPTTAQVLAEAWAAKMHPLLRSVQVAELTHTAVAVRNLLNPTDRYELLVNLGGLQGGDFNTAFDAYGIAVRGDTAVTRPGAKRIAGVYDAAVTDGVITNTTVINALTTLSNAMTTAVQVGLILPSDVFFPVIVKRVREGVEGAYTYRLPETSAELNWSTIVVAIFNALVTSQVSRKIGRGQ